MTRPSQAAQRVEQMFCRFKDWRRIAARFDRNLKNFMGAICFAAVIWWL
jgi:transposase